MNASSFVDSIGVNTHMTYLDTVYGNVQAAGDALAYLGVDMVRDYLPSWLPGPYDQLAARGVEFNFFFPGQAELSAYVNTLTAFAQAHPGAIASIEGPNEVNYWPLTWNGETDLAAQVDFQKAFFTALNANSVLKDIPVYNLTLGGVGSSTFAELGDMTGSADFANVHMYFGAGAPPSAYWSYAIGLGQIPMPGAPTAITETGYTTAVNHAQGVDEVTQAKYLLDLLMDAAAAGVKATFLYELVDQKVDPAKTDKEGAFGLFRNDWTPKVAATAIHNLTSVLTDGGSPAGADAALAYNVTGLASNGRHVLFQEGDGAFDIVVWAEADIWNETTKTQIAAPSQQVTITLPQAVSGYLVYDPMTGAAPITTGGPTSQITVTISDHPLIIELRPDGGAAAPAPEPVSEPVPAWSPPPSTTTATAGDGAVTGVEPIDYVAGGVTFSGKGKSEAIEGGSASDVLKGGGGADFIRGGAAFDNLSGDGGNDTIFGGAGADWIVGGKDQDLLQGEGEDDIIYGNAGNDTVGGGDGADVLRGGQGADSLQGGAGADWIAGDKGADTLAGGADADLFRAFGGCGIDRVVDFSSADGDRVMLDAGATYTLKFVGADTIVDLGGGNQVILAGVTQSTLGDWLAA